MGIVLMLGTVVTAADTPLVKAGTPSEQQLHAPQERESFAFLIFGDRTGGPPEGIKVLADGVTMANRLDVDLVLTVGDLIEGYNEPEQWLPQMHEFKDTMDRLKMPWYPVAGNHDVYARPKKTGGHMDLYQKHFGPLYYSFDYKWTHFIILFSDESLSFRDPTSSQNMSSEQKAWLLQDLKSTQASQVFVFLHHPRWTDEYAGCNWNDVHRLFVEDGRPITVFAGHIHTYRDDGQRENVHYYALATAGGHKTRFQQTASRHHANLVRVRPDRIAVSVLPIGAVLAGNFVLGEEVEMMKTLARGEWLELSGPAAIGLEANLQSSFALTLSNPTDRALHFNLNATASRGWQLQYQPVDRSLDAGEELTVTIQATAPALGEKPPLITVNTKANYTLRSGLFEPIEVQTMVPIDLRVPEDLAEADPENNGVLTLDGSSAVRVNVPEQLDCFTLECWVRGQPPSGRTALVAKTQGSSYGIFWCEESSGDKWPTGYVSTKAGYLSVPAAEAWQWDQWTHVALVFDSQRAAFFVNGQLQSEKTTTARATHNRHPLYIGADPDGAGRPTNFFTGQVDELRLSRVARYAGSFKPRRVFEQDTETIILLHFDRELPGTFLDDSGTAHHGWAVGRPKVERANR